jgi:zinc transporter, ZIP family
MLAAFGWGLLAASPLVAGGLIAARWRLPRVVLGLVMAFGSGVLIAALAYELALKALTESDEGVLVAAGLAAGCAVFFCGDAVLDRRGGHERKRSHGGQRHGDASAIVLGIILDGIPESLVIGIGLTAGGSISIAVVAAVFLSNLPEALAASTGLSRAGWPARRLAALWITLTLVQAAAAVVGYALFADAPGDLVAIALAFAAGAILTMLADTMMPEAFEYGGRLTGVVTTLGFAVAFLLSVA